MAETVKFTCNRCKVDIEIDRKNSCGAVFFKKRYYHQNCFCELCREKASSNRSLLSWQEILDDISVYQNDVIPNINYRFAKDDLNEWILNHYDVKKLPNRFWNVVADLENGTGCNPVPTKLLFETWRWGQKKLDAINRKNRIAKKGPTTDAQRVNYDLAIVLKHVPDYEKYLAKLAVEEAERIAREKERVKINYNNIHSAPVQTEGLDDISDLLDEF